ncbi:MAG: LysM peptidoglycan-binding domain-containing protein [Pseudomonadota bacterium]
MKGRDGILVLLVMLAVGALSILGYWIGSARFEPTEIAGRAPQPVADASSAADAGRPPSSDGSERDASPRVALDGAAQDDAVSENATAATAEAPADQAPLAAAPLNRALSGAARLGAEAPPDSGGASLQAAEGLPPSFPTGDTPPLGEADELPPLDRRAVAATREESVRVDAPGRGVSGEAGAGGSVRVAAAPTNDAQVESNDSEFDRTSTTPERIAATAPTEPVARGEDLEDRPSFDLVRVAPDGSTVLAGRAQPGAVVSVLLDGELAAEVRADRRGEFVALVDAAFGDRETRSLNLSAENADGETLLAAAPVILTRPAEPGQAPVAVRPSAQGAVVMQTGERVAQDGVSIDAVSYDEKGNVVVAGRGKPGSTTRLYLDNALSAQAQVNPDGEWRVRVAQEIKPARYTLRVDQLSTAGVVIGRAETPFEREPVQDIVLRAGAVVVQPGNNLWRIATYVYGDGFQYTVIYEGNRTQIRDPDLIYPGQILDLPNAPGRTGGATESN